MVTYDDDDDDDDDSCRLARVSRSEKRPTTRTPRP